MLFIQILYMLFFLWVRAAHAEKGAQSLFPVAGPSAGTQHRRTSLDLWIRCHARSTSPAGSLGSLGIKLGNRFMLTDPTNNIQYSIVMKENGKRYILHHSALSAAFSSSQFRVPLAKTGGFARRHLGDVGQIWELHSINVTMTVIITLGYLFNNPHVMISVALWECDGLLKKVQTTKSEVAYLESIAFASLQAFAQTHMTWTWLVTLWWANNRRMLSLSLSSILLRPWQAAVAALKLTVLGSNMFSFRSWRGIKQSSGRSPVCLAHKQVDSVAVASSRMKVGKP